MDVRGRSFVFITIGSLRDTKSMCLLDKVPLFSWLKQHCAKLIMSGRLHEIVLNYQTKV